MHVLVTGGAGYLGAHVVLALLQAGHVVDVVDDFTRGTPASLGRAEALTGRHVTTHAADVADIDALERVFAVSSFDAVVHLAGLRSTATSVDRVLDTYETNLTTTFTLLRCMSWYGVDKLVLSSSSSVYGAPATDEPLLETAPLAPLSPLGRSLASNEHLLDDLAHGASHFRFAVVRCFTTAGAHPSGRIGQYCGRSATALLARIGQVAAGRRDRLEVHGDAHATPDGTAVRDYVHPDDVAAGHVAALESLAHRPAGVSTWNLGTGRPSSVLDVVRTFEEVSGRRVPVQVVGGRRASAARLVADTGRAAADLGWTAARTLADICRDHWHWQQQNPRGYPSTVAPEAPWRGGIGHRLRVLPPLPRTS
ncbi:UDP-glucose 4-epimerase GalE [Isoptericola jiangsuensis]|uniref:UDP-glucose 4-epimerase GalE n=1 Tax=Isoptericola jiangsuensis TaxID=548579 RepID=UPI003AAF604F